jgi:hypothetical protein
MKSSSAAITASGLRASTASSVLAALEVCGRDDG